tara:strand:+ start:1473 stop:1700 length:228 start_codon:yes stop_codon:yes gene_type:complete
MTDEKLLTLLGDYCHVQLDIVEYMTYARKDFDIGQEQASWKYLFEWADAMERRKELRRKFKGNYIRALMLKEGVV